MKKLSEYFTKMDEFLNRIDGATDEEAKKIIDEMASFGMEFEYGKLSEGFVYESKDIVNVLEHFLSVGDVVKSRYLCYVLNTHYKGATSKLMEDLLAEEKYESCAVLNKVIDTKEFPSEK